MVREGLMVYIIRYWSLWRNQDLEEDRGVANERKKEREQKSLINAL